MMQLLKMSVTGSVMILVITLLRVLLQNKLHRSVILSLWFLAVLRLTVPLFPKSSASIYNVLPQQAPTVLPTTPSGETDDLTFADMNGETPSVSIPVIAPPIP